MESMDKSYKRLFKATVLSVCIAVMIMAMRTKPASADNSSLPQENVNTISTMPDC